MSYVSLLYHVVFRTKDSIPAIDVQCEESLYSYIWGFIKNHNSKLYRIGGMPDHLHLLVEIHPNIAVSDFIRDLKRASSKWLSDNPDFPLFGGWAEGYAAFTYSSKEKEVVRNYIKNQKEHHRVVSFSEEFEAWLAENGMTKDWV